MLKTTDKKGILEGLLKLAESDADFCGENGHSYKWDCAKRFESNAKWVISQVKTIKDYQECVNEFMKLWMDSDNYYGQYDIGILYNEKKRPIAISLAYTY